MLRGSFDARHRGDVVFAMGHPVPENEGSVAWVYLVGTRRGGHMELEAQVRIGQRGRSDDRAVEIMNQGLPA